MFHVNFVFNNFGGILELLVVLMDVDNSPRQYMGMGPDPSP